MELVVIRLLLLCFSNVVVDVVISHVDVVARQKKEQIFYLHIT
jgi:hypothetical protein